MYIHDLFLQIFTDLDTELPVRKSQICLEAKPGGVSVGKDVTYILFRNKA